MWKEERPFPAAEDDRLEAVRQALMTVVRVGRVTVAYPQRCTVRVKFQDLDGEVSWEFPVLQPKAGKDRHFFVPDVGEDVVCLMLPFGREQGFVVGGYYAPRADDPPKHETGKHYVGFADGSSVEYDRERHAFHFEHMTGAKIAVTADGSIQLYTPADLCLTTERDFKTYVGRNAVVERVVPQSPPDVSPSERPGGT